MTFARLLCRYASLHPPINPNRWDPVTKTEDLGVFIQLPDRQRFLFRTHVEVREGEPETPTSGAGESFGSPSWAK